MMKDLFKNYIYPIATLTSGIIGVGFLSLPYITLQVGIWTMLFYFVVLGVFIIFIHVIFGQISLATPDFKRFPGFVGFYLGKWPERASLAMIMIGSFGILLAYLIVGGQFLSNIMSPVFGGSEILYVFLYFVLASALIYFGINVIAKFEFWALVLLAACLILVFFDALPQIHLANIFAVPMHQGSWKTLFLPYGAIMFSLWGTGLIPETEEMVTGRKQSLKKIIIFSILISAAIYLVFIFLILGITGSQTTESALSGLASLLGGPVAFLALFIGVITTFTAFVAQGLILKKVFAYDMGFKKFPAWALTCFIPLIIFLAGFNYFIPLISFIGGVLLSVDGIFILLMYRKIGGKKVVAYPLILFFILGIIYELVYFVK